MDSPYLSYNKSMGELKLTNGNISFIFNLKEGRYHIENENGTIKALFPSVNVYRNFDKSKWKSFCLDGSNLNASDYLGKLKTKKILIIHGTGDASINYNRSKQFYFILKNLGSDVVYMETNNNHSDIKLNSFRKIVSWIKK